ncbi:ABC transporter substrate-binding protein [Spirillospora sp. CA-108201]
MRRIRRSGAARLTAVAALAVALPLGMASGCSGKASGGSGGTGPDGVRTGPGVTDAAIRLGVETDLTDSDMSAQVAALKSAGVKAILLSAGPKQSASLAGLARAKGMTAPIVASNSGFSPQLLQTAAAPALLKDFYLAGAGAPVSSGLAPIRKLADDYGRKYPGQPRDSAVVNGYTGAVIFADALKKACAAKDLTREGLITAHRSTTAHDGGYGTPMDFSKVDEPGTRRTYILRTDAKALGGLVVERQPAESEAAETYKVPAGA